MSLKLTNDIYAGLVDFPEQGNEESFIFNQYGTRKTHILKSGITKLYPSSTATFTFIYSDNGVMMEHIENPSGDSFVQVPAPEGWILPEFLK